MRAVEIAQSALVVSAVFAALEWLWGALLQRTSTTFAAFDARRRRIVLNHIGSLTHSAILSVAVVWCLFHLRDSLFDETILTAMSPASETTILFSLGYFLFDAVSMQVKGLFKGDVGMAVHHMAVIVVESSVLMGTGQCHVLTLLMLMAEVNSVFLHVRVLLRSFLQQAGVSVADSSAYCATVMAVHITFPFSRTVPHVWVLCLSLRYARPMGWLGPGGALASAAINVLDMLTWRAVFRAERKLRLEAKGK